MYLFSRRGRLAPAHLRDSIAWAQGQTERVTQITGLPVSLYSQMFSPGVGTIVWSVFVEGLEELEAANDKLAADDGFNAAADQGAGYLTGGFDDGLVSLIHGEPDPNRPIDYVTSVQTVCANGGVAKGLELGVALAQKAEQITGLPTLFGVETTGSYGGVGWLTGYAGIRELQTAQEKLNGDAEWLRMIDDGVKGVYTDDPAASVQRVYRRVV